MSMEDKIKQIIVFRKDLLPLPAGKISAQVAHAAMLFILRKIVPYRICEADYPGYPLLVAAGFSEVEKYWMTEHFTKVVVGCKGLPQLLKLEEEAREAGLEVNVMKDLGFTCFNGETITCIAIGPDLSSKIDPITKRLQLLQ